MHININSIQTFPKPIEIKIIYKFYFNFYGIYVNIYINLILNTYNLNLIFIQPCKLKVQFLKKYV